MIIVCGEALMDFVPVQAGMETAYVPRPGGSPFNVAIGLARLGVPTSFLSKISNDPFGLMLKSHLADNGVDLSLVRDATEPSTLAFVSLPQSGEHDFYFYGNNTADQRLLYSELPDALPEGTQAIHFSSYSLVLGETASTLQRLMQREQGKAFISLDPNVRPALYPHRQEYVARIESLLPYATLVKVSQADLTWLYPEADYTDIAKSWLEHGPVLVVVTLGEKGATAFSKTLEAHVKGKQVSVADAVGAGDAFMSGLLSHLYAEGLLSLSAIANLTVESLTDALEFANNAAALTCTRPGADPPQRDEIDMS